jgi:hypothetical protein
MMFAGAESFVNFHPCCPHGHHCLSALAYQCSSPAPLAPRIAIAEWAKKVTMKKVNYSTPN